MTYKEYSEQKGITVQSVRVALGRAAQKGKLTKVSVFEDREIPNDVMLFLTGNTSKNEVVSAANWQIEKVSKKSAKQATIPARFSVQYTEPEKRGIETPVKSQMSSVFLILRSLSSADKAMIAICVITAYGLISQYRFMGFGAAVVYSIFAMNTSRLTKAELSLQSAKMSVNWLIFFDIALAYVHSTMYYQEITTNAGLMINKEGWGVIVTSLAFGIGTSLVAVIILLVSIKETWEKAEHNYQNAPAQN